jgi:hypothetical protein
MMGLSLAPITSELAAQPADNAPPASTGACSHRIDMRELWWSLRLRGVETNAFGP